MKNLLIASVFCALLFAVSNMLCADEKLKVDPNAVNTAIQVMSKPATILCDAAELRVFSGNRFHVRCANPAGGIAYFAMPLSDSAANLSMELILSAFSKHKSVAIEYVPLDVSGDSYGCLKADCRTIRSVTLQQE